MKEVEVKARVKNEAELVSVLQKLGCKLSDPVTQKDIIFIPEGSTIPLPMGVNALRIREQDGRFIFTLKQPVKNQLDCIEKEVLIDNPDKMTEICRLLGFVESSRLNKTRRSCHYSEFEICLDSVENLGTFIEVEKISEDGEGEKLQRELYDFLDSLGIGKEERVYDGYDILLKNQKF